MKSNPPKRPTPILGMVCTVFGHNFKVTRKVTNHINEYKCEYCEKEFTDNLKGSVEVLTNKTKELNSIVSSFCHRRVRRTITHLE